MSSTPHSNRPTLELSLACGIVLMALTALAETNLVGLVGLTNQPATPANAPAIRNPGTNQIQHSTAYAQRAEQIRIACINGRRRICGRVLQIVPEGLVVDSGYTSLLRPEISGSWVVRSTVSATRPPNLVEENTPGTVCVGLVFVTDIPRKPAVKVYDYVMLEAYPAGQYAYAPVPNVKKNIRRFAGGLLTATKLNLRDGEQ